jgi:DNA-binding beta-propeller fold protein YncE
VLNPGTATLYVPYGNLLNKVAAVDIATCNAQEASGCSLPHGTVTVGQGTHELAIDYATGTLYAASTYAVISGPITYTSALQGTASDSVYVVNGQTCNGTDFTGCTRAPVTVRVGTFPYGLAVDDATHTLYVADNRNGDLPGEVTMVNTSTCNGFISSGCHKVFPTAYIGRSARLVALDQEAGVLYITDRGSAAVSVLRTADCNSEVTKGCPALAPELAVGSKPVGLAVDQATGTVYIANTVSGTMSVLNARPLG